jgi:hypothetical protein
MNKFIEFFCGRCWFFAWADKWFCSELYIPYGGGLQCFHCSPENRRRRRKMNPVPGVYNWATLPLGDIDTGTWPSTFWGLDARVTTLLCQIVFLRHPKNWKPESLFLETNLSEFLKQDYLLNRVVVSAMIMIYIVTWRLKVGFCDVHCYATTSQSARCIRCDRCYSTDTQQFFTVKHFLNNQIVATEDTTVREGVLYPVRKIRLRG